MATPSVYEYMDFRDFLRDWFSAKKRGDRSYSYSAFGRAGGCSRSALANVLGGTRTPRPATVDAFARAMSLSPPERNFLGLLVELDGARDLTQRSQAMARVLTTARNPQVRQVDKVPEAAASRYLEHWYIPAIQELAGLPGFKEDPVWIAANLYPPIEAEQARLALDTLFDLGFLKRDDGGRVVKGVVRLRSDSETFSLAVARFHRQVLPALMHNIDTERSAEQHLLSVTLTLPTSAIAEMKQKLNAMLEQMANMADDPMHEGPARVYQLSVQLLPVSAELS